MNIPQRTDAALMAGVCAAPTKIIYRVFPVTNLPNFQFIIFAILVTFSATPFAMDLKITANTLLLSGEVVARDLDQVKEAFKATPAITHVVLRNSMGGNSWTGYRLGELFRERGVTTAVSGFCVSACSRLFLGGKVRMFSDDYPASLTYVGFHGQYDFGKLNPAAMKKDDLVGWTTKFTDGKVDQKLMQRWTAIERRAGDVRFYPDAVTAQFKRATMLCQGTESLRPQQCEMIATDALMQGIVTTNTYYSSPDASTLPYKIREQRFPTTQYATPLQTDRLPTRNPTLQRDFEAFKNSALPRAFALSANGTSWGWSANDPRSPEEALTRCQSRSAKAICTLYAVDERIVYSEK